MTRLFRRFNFANSNLFAAVSMFVVCADSAKTVKVFTPLKYTRYTALLHCCTKYYRP